MDFVRLIEKVVYVYDVVEVNLGFPASLQTDLETHLSPLSFRYLIISGELFIFPYLITSS